MSDTAATPTPATEDWKAWATRVVVAAALAAVIGLAGTAVGIPWPEAAGAGWAAVGGWYVSLATHTLGRALAVVGAGRGRGPDWPPGPLGSVPALGVWALSSGLAAAIAGPPLLVFGVVSVVVANATFTAGALLRRYALDPSGDGSAHPVGSDGLRAADGRAQASELAARTPAEGGEFRFGLGLQRQAH